MLEWHARALGTKRRNRAPLHRNQVDGEEAQALGGFVPSRRPPLAPGIGAGHGSGTQGCRTLGPHVHQTSRQQSVSAPHGRRRHLPCTRH